MPDSEGPHLRTVKGFDAGLPQHHVRPAQGWVNDPNGPVWWRGWYHVFFQHNPHAAVHHQISWGHASSVDLATWDEHPVALIPSPSGPDALGCWSGCIVADTARATAYYTGTRSDPADAIILKATSEDDALEQWTKFPTPVATAPPSPGQEHPTQDVELAGIRDPFVFTHQDTSYAVVGSGAAAPGRPMVLLYSCEDPDAWAYRGVLLDVADVVAAREAPGDFWECPQLFRLDGHWVLIVSVVAEQRAARVHAFLGDLVESDTGFRFVCESGALLDHGHSFYAPAVLPADDGEVYMWAWAWDDATEGATPARDWSGSLTFTRRLYLGANGTVGNAPVLALDTLHRNTRTVRGFNGTLEHTIAANAFDVTVDLLPVGPEPVRVSLGEAFALTIDHSAGEVELHHRTPDPIRDTWAMRAGFERDADLVRVRVVVDGDLAEIFIEGGPSFTESVSMPRPARLRVAASRGTGVEARVADFARPNPPPATPTLADHPSLGVT